VILIWIGDSATSFSGLGWKIFGDLGYWSDADRGWWSDDDDVHDFRSCCGRRTTSRSFVHRGDFSI